MKNLIKKLIVRLGCSARNAETFRQLWCDLDAINRLIQVNISTAFLHQQTFPRFKGIYAGRDIVVVATGPSLKDYKPIVGCVNIGVNHAFLNENLVFDYMFAQDYHAVKEIIPRLNAYKRGECVKFYGLTMEYSGEQEINRVIPESDAMVAGALRYRTDWAPIDGFKPNFYFDISSMPVACCGSVVFPAMQFALWTHPKRIYIVGCDCSRNGHFVECNSGASNGCENLVSAWCSLKRFASRYYPDTEIISVNPVGLRGVFRDVDQ